MPPGLATKNLSKKQKGVGQKEDKKSRPGNRVFGGAECWGVTRGKGGI